jgi:hypothetical protein
MLSLRNCVVLSAVLILPLLMAVPAHAQPIDLWCTPVDANFKDKDGRGFWVTIDERAGTLLGGIFDRPTLRVDEISDKVIRWHEKVPFDNNLTDWYHINRETGILEYRSTYILNRTTVTGVQGYYKCTVGKKEAPKKKF